MKTDRDKFAEDLVTRTEVWPSSVETPEDIIKKDIIYSSPEGHDLELTYFTQENPEEKRPAILFIHGGSWKMGDRKQFFRQSIHLTKRFNFFAACIEYRLSDAAPFPSALEDCKTAMRWLCSVSDEHSIDTERIAVCGGSAGAHLAALTALSNGTDKYDTGPYLGYPGTVKLAVLFNGHFDLSEQLREHIQDEDMRLFFSGSPWEKPDLYGEASPILLVNEKSPPMLFLHGELDHYPYKQSIYMADRLQYFGVDAEVEIYKGKGHAWFNSGPDLQLTTERMAKFLKKHFLL